MHHDNNSLGSPCAGHAAPCSGGTADGEIVPGSMAQAGSHHADELGSAVQAQGPAEGCCCSPNILGGPGSDGPSGAAHAEPVGALGAGPGDGEALWSGIRGNGERCWKIDLCRLLNTAAGEKVIDDRQLRRHASRGGHRFLDGRFVNIPRYIAWLADEVHAPPAPKRLTSHAGTVTRDGILHVIEQQQRRCALTGRHLLPDEATLDHNLPVSRGGEHTLSNIQILHRDVNRAKSTMTNAEFIALCCEVAAWAHRSTSN